MTCCGLGAAAPHHDWIPLKPQSGLSSLIDTSPPMLCPVQIECNRRCAIRYAWRVQNLLSTFSGGMGREPTIPGLLNILSATIRHHSCILKRIAIFCSISWPLALLVGVWLAGSMLIRRIRHYIREPKHIALPSVAERLSAVRRMACSPLTWSTVYSRIADSTPVAGVCRLSLKKGFLIIFQLPHSLNTNSSGFIILWFINVDITRAHPKYLYIPTRSY